MKQETGERRGSATQNQELRRISQLEPDFMNRLISYRFIVFLGFSGLSDKVRLCLQTWIDSLNRIDSYD